MPAKDRYHDAVVRALIKAGWRVTDEQVTLAFGQRFLWVDIQAESRLRGVAILVEVKQIEDAASPVDA